MFSQTTDLQTQDFVEDELVQTQGFEEHEGLTFVEFGTQQDAGFTQDTLVRCNQQHFYCTLYRVQK